MALNCPVIISQLPVLQGCPADDEFFLVGNAAGGLDAQGNLTFGFGLRTWGQIRSCLISQTLRAGFAYIKIGSIADPRITVNADSLVINIPGIIVDSVNLAMGGSTLPREDDTQISYDVTYGANSTEIDFDYNFQNGDWFVITFAYTI